MGLGRVEHNRGLETIVDNLSVQFKCSNGGCLRKFCYGMSGAAHNYKRGRGVE